LHTTSPDGRPRAGALAACLATAGLAVLAGCATTVSTHAEWNEGAPRDRAYSRLLVIGLTPDINQRCAFEDAVAQNLRNAAVTAKTSCAVLGTHEPITREAVERGIASFDADAVLATHLVEAQAGLEEGGTHETRGAGYYKPVGYGYATGYWGVYGVPVVYGQFETAPSVLSVQGSGRIATSLYETRGATLVYTVETSATDLETRSQALVQIAPAITDRLRKDGLVP